MFCLIWDISRALKHWGRFLLNVLWNREEWKEWRSNADFCFYTMTTMMTTVMTRMIKVMNMFSSHRGPFSPKGNLIFQTIPGRGQPLPSK
jgi:hypothetical protein